MVVDPVIMPKRAKRPPKPQMRRTFSSSLFGTQEIVAGGNPGSALAEAFAQSEKGTVITVEVPAKQYTKFRRAPKLQIYSRDGKRQFERPFVAGGEPINEAEATAAMAKALSRVVQPLVLKNAEIVKNCGGMPAPTATDRFIRIDSASLPDSQSIWSRVWVTTRPRGTEKRALTERGPETAILRQGNSACIGPLSVSGNSDVFIYDPEMRWLASIRVGTIR